MEEILHQAEQLEKEYDWLGASTLYEKALNLLPEDDYSRKGEMHERLGYVFYRAAFQAESNDDVQEKDTSGHSELSRRPRNSMEDRKTSEGAQKRRCDAMIALMDYWLAEKVLRRKS